MQLVTIGQALQRSCREIDHTDMRILLQHVLNVDHAFLLTHPDQVLTSKQEEIFDQLVARRVNGEPVAYLTGERDFYDLTFKVTPAVLIPRPETELLVEFTLERIPANHACRVLDLGTGSGAIAITIARHRPQVSVVAVDLSADAVSIARMNARNLEVNNISIVTSDWFGELLGEKFDLIVSNPPYVADGDSHLKQGDLRFEPRMALAADADGMACIKKIISAATEYLVPDGWLLLEHGYDQAAACRQLLEEAGYRNTFSRPDLAGIMRVSGGVI
ncbi:MAG: peptide chain release factor N(5)-glutamine methyltransferase [Nitrosomonas sp.]|nr:peptide chain release factor N(5)-glutamine methyltransferase [Nitrosomonas sp.]MDP1950165.1 peptide chain release factor N(5)-glutamine methyltransferase [Nitrosomonas sp.]